MNTKKLRTRSRSAELKLETLKLPKPLTDGIDKDCFSLAVDCIDLAVIEVAGCVYEKLDLSIERLIERADSYTEYFPRSEGIRIIGYSYGHLPLEMNYVLETSDCANTTLSIYRCCDRWVDISGIPIYDRPFANIDSTINDLLAKTRSYLRLS
jgi:hypothetical protein